MGKDDSSSPNFSQVFSLTLQLEARKDINVRTYIILVRVKTSNVPLHTKEFGEQLTIYNLFKQKGSLCSKSNVAKKPRLF